SSDRIGDRQTYDTSFFIFLTEFFLFTLYQQIQNEVSRGSAIAIRDGI
ncbi:MAG: hypothetical protein ACI90V_012341, partial [Bacillariaceae sp.]